MAGNPTNPAEVIEVLCEELGVVEADLFDLPPDFLGTVIATSGRTNAQKAAAHLALNKLRLFRANQGPQGQRDLAEYFRERDARELFPWKAAESAAKVQLEAFETAFRQPDPFENLRRIFLAQAKGGLIAPLENVVLQYLLFGSADAARFQLASLLLTVPVPNRLAVHNWNVAASMAPARRESYGSQIAACPFPLFPDSAELMTLNSRLLSEVRAPSVQGGAAEPPHSNVFARRNADEVFGAGFCPVTGPDGVQTHAVNTTSLEAAIAALARGRGGPHRGRGHQRGRGRGRGRNHSYRGGDAEDDQDDTTPKNE